jgi:hypothetical protein
MTKLDGKLGDYVGIGMAAMMVGRSPEQTGVIYDLISVSGMQVYKIGGVSLLRFDDFAYNINPVDAGQPLWPDELADLPMQHLYSRSELWDSSGYRSVYLEHALTILLQPRRKYACIAYSI